MPYFINADLEITSQESLELLREEWGDAVSVLSCDWQDDGSFFASFEINVAAEVTDAEVFISDFCKLIESLSTQGRRIWESATRRVIDLGYQPDNGDRVVRSNISATTLERMGRVGIDLAVTVYPLEGKLSAP